MDGLAARHSRRTSACSRGLGHDAGIGGAACNGGFLQSVANCALVASGSKPICSTIDHGGRIFVHAGTALSASVSNGGNVTYWGDPLIISSIRLGGVVEKGIYADLARPIADFDPQLPPLPALPSIRPLRPGGGH